MQSPSSSRKPNNGYVSLSEDTALPKSKSKLSKTISTPGLPPPPPPKPRSNSTDLPPPSFFTAGGGASFGYSLSSMHKPKRSEHHTDDNEHNTAPIDINHSPFSKKSRSLHGSRPKFKPSEFSRPQLAGLPAKFRAAFEERKKKNLPSTTPSLSDENLPDIREDLSHIERRPPSLVDMDLKMPVFLTDSYEDTSSRSQRSLSEEKSSLKSATSEELSVAHSPGSVSPQLSITMSACLQLPVTFAQPAPREMDYFEKDNSRHMFERLSKLRREGHLCDITVSASSEDIKAHRIVLAASSTYFESILIGENALPEGELLYIEEIDEGTLPLLVDFAYTSRIKITDRNIYSIFEAADVLGFSGVKGACCKFLKLQMNKSNCIGTWLFAQDQNSAELMEATLHYIESNFLDIARGREFLTLDRPEVVAKIVELEEIAITSEEQVYEAVLGWVTYDLEWRRCHAPQVFAKVRFPSMSRDFLLHIVDHEPVIKEDPDLLQQLIEALECHVASARSTLRKKLKKKGSQLSGLEPRHASTAVEMVSIETDGRPLGVLVMGGADRPNAVFRQGDKPGVFVAEIRSDGAANKLGGRLRVGDRILTVNSEDVGNAKHDHVINLLKTSPSPLSLLVRHEAPPPGLVWLTLVTKPGEGFGFSVRGGVNSLQGNPLDDTDEGVFISQIAVGGAAEMEPRLPVGTRILQVNSQSLLGKTHEEALLILHSVVDRMNLLCCHGYDPLNEKNSDGRDSVAS